MDPDEAKVGPGVLEQGDRDGAGQLPRLLHHEPPTSASSFGVYWPALVPADVARPRRRDRRRAHRHRSRRPPTAEARPPRPQPAPVETTRPSPRRHRSCPATPRRSRCCSTTSAERRLACRPGDADLLGRAARWRRSPSAGSSAPDRATRAATPTSGCGHATDDAYDWMQLVPDRRAAARPDAGRDRGARGRPVRAARTCGPSTSSSAGCSGAAWPRRPAPTRRPRGSASTCGPSRWTSP